MADDDFDKLQQQYHDATIDERNRLWPDFIRAIRERYPGFLEEVDRKFRNGDYLRAILEECMKRVFARPDLDGGRKANAQEDAAVAMAVFDEFQQADSRWRELAFELATRTLLTGLRAGLSPKEVENLRIDFARKGGTTRKKEKPAVAHARELAHEIAEENPTSPSVWIADQIPQRWRLRGVACPKDGWLVTLVRRWRRNGVVPRRAGPSRRQTHPLKRFRRF